jgi:hypothetical protein
MSKTRITIVQINSSFSGCHYLPYSAGLLEAYARTYCKNIDGYEFLLPIYKREPVQKIVEKIQDADIVAFSAYVWNIRLSLAVAKAIKEINPNVFIIFGGPQVPDKSEEFLRANPFIDMVVNGEGERVFTHILENFKDKTFEDLKSISYINKDGGFVGKPKIDRIKSLDEIPSPYTTGIFNDLMWANPNEQWLVMWETDRGCPFSCCFSSSNYIALSDRIVKFDEEIYETQHIECNDPTHRHTKCISDNRMVYQGKRECLRIELRNGSFIEVTPEHNVKLFDRKTGELIDAKAEDLGVGDYLPIQVGQNNVIEYQTIPKLKIDYAKGIGRRDPKRIRLPEYLDEDLAWFLGYIIGDGCLSAGKPDKDGSPCIRPSLHMAITDKYEEKLHCLIDKLFGLKLKVHKANNTTKMKHGWVDSRLLVRFLNESIGMGIKKDKLKVPRLIFRSPKSVCEAFLNGLWAADGHVPDSGARFLSTVSHILAMEVCCVLQWVGYISRIYRAQQCTDAYGNNDIYNIYWYEADQKCRFVNETNIENIYKCEIVDIIKTDAKDIYDIGNPPTFMVASGGVLIKQSFCDWGSAIASKVSQFDMDRLYKEVDWMSEYKIEFIFCCDANFGMLKRAIDIAQYVGTNKEKYGYPKALSVQNAKNATDRVFQVQKILGDYGLNKGVTLSIQSLNKDTLDSIKRGNISSESYASLQKRFAQEKIPTYTDLILGMPCETYDSMKCNIAKLVEDGQHNRIQFNNLSILPNAGMGTKDYQKKYGMIIIDSIAISMHNSLEPSEDGVDEWQELVVGTDSCPKEDWIKTRAFCWMVAFLYFDKILQIPIATLRTITDIPYKDWFDLFFESDLSKYPVLNGIRKFFIDGAKSIQNGGPEYCPAPEWLNIWYPHDEFILIKTIKENNLDGFYQDCEDLILSYLKSKGIYSLDRIVMDGIKLNKSLIQLPIVNDILSIDLSYNIYEYYQSILVQSPIILEESPIRYHINRQKDHRSTWEDWYKYTIWYGNKAGHYLNKNVISENIKHQNISNLPVYDINVLGGHH